MNVWMIVSIVLMLACGGLAVLCFHQSGQISASRQRETAEEDREREWSRLRTDCLRARRDADALRRALEQEQDRSDVIEDTLIRCQDDLSRTEELLRTAERARAEEEKKRITAEKDAGAGRMRAQLLESQAEKMRKEMAAQEKLYQDILREREETIERLQDQQRRRPRKKTQVLDQQVTLNDILKGM